VVTLTQLYIFLKSYQGTLTSLSRVLLEKLTGLQLVKKLPTFYGTRRFITAFTSARQLNPVHTLTSPFLKICNSPPMYAWVSPVVYFPQVFPSKLCTLLSPPPYALHAPPISFFYYVTRTVVGKQYRPLSSS
jgi:hypothetical protein